MVDKIYISWEDFHQDTKNLCRKIKECGSFDKIIAVSRGGLIPAGILAYELGIRNTAVINIISYNDEHHLDNAKIFGFDGEADEKTLIIDDLSDTGNSINLLRRKYHKAKYAVVYAKPQGLNAPDIFEKQVPDQWLVFPWD